MRLSEVAALDVYDIERAADSTGRLTIRASKTDQKGTGVVVFLGAPTVRRVLAWTEAAGLYHAALFRRVRRGDALGPGRLSARAWSCPVYAELCIGGVGPSHPHAHRPARSGRRCRGPCIGTLNAGRRLTVACRRGRKRGRDAGGGPLAFARDA